MRDNSQSIYKQTKCQVNILHKIRNLLFNSDYALPSTGHLGIDDRRPVATEMPFDCFFHSIHSFAIQLNFKLVIVIDAILLLLHRIERVCVHSTPTPVRWRTQLPGTAHVHNALHERPDPERGKLNKMILNCVRSFAVPSSLVYGRH